MKKLLFTLLSLIPLTIFGQISVTKTADEKIERIIKYDSLNNFLGKEYSNYIGQDLFLNPMSESLRKYGYENFFLDPNGLTYGKSNVFRCCDSYGSKYEDLQGKIFKVIDVLEDPANYDDAFLKLKLKDTDEVVFYRYSKKYSHSFSFIVMGYLEKMKELFIGNDVLIRKFKSELAAKITDIDSGEVLSINTEEHYKCLDITLDDKHYSLKLVLENKTKQKFLFSLGYRHSDVVRIFLKDEAELYRVKFGASNWKTILEEKFKIGFTEEMTILSLGKPDEINRSTSGDQWVYSSQYLYFEDGILESWN
jgi:hypothetical protein